MKNIEIKNTLNLINIILLTAQINDEKESENITQSISNYLKYLSEDISIVKLNYEISILKEYLNILSRRYSFTYNCKCLENNHYYIRQMELIKFMESYIFRLNEQAIDINMLKVTFDITDNELLINIKIYNDYSEEAVINDTFTMKLEVN